MIVQAPCQERGLPATPGSHASSPDCCPALLALGRRSAYPCQSVPSLSPQLTVLCLAFSFGAIVPAAASEPLPEELPPGAEGAPMGLPEAVERALALHPTAQVAGARLSRAAGVRGEALSALLPTVSIGLSYTRRPNEVRRDVGGTEVVFQALDAVGASATAEVDVLDAGAIQKARQAGPAAAALEIDAEAIRRDLAFEVGEAFCAVRSAERQVQAAERRRSLAELLVSAAKARTQAGVAGQGEADRAGIELRSARIALLETRQSLGRARLLFALYVGDEAGQRPLADPPALAADPGTADPLRRDDVRAAELRAAVARLGVSAPALSMLPVLTLRGTVRLTNEAGFTGRTVDGTFGVALTWALWDGGLRIAQASLRAAERVEAEAAVETLANAARLDLALAKAEVETTAAALAEAEERARLAHRFAEGTTLRFREGIATILEEADAAGAAFEADTDLARRELAHDLAGLALLRALGRWPT